MGPVGEPPEPDLRTLQVGQHADGAAGGIGGGAHPFVGGFVVGVVAVAEIQSGDVHSGLDQRPDSAHPSAVAGPSVQTIFPRLLTSNQP